MFPPEGLMRAHGDPRLGEASRTLAQGMLDAAAADRRLDGIFKDVGRYTAVVWANHLQGTGELTLPRLKAACVASGFASSSRTRDLLTYLLHLECIEPVAPAQGAEPARYALTDAFRASWRRYYRAALQAACILEPAVRPVLDRLDEPQVFNILARLHSAALLSVSPEIVQQDPYVRIFLHRRAGAQIICALLTAEAAERPSLGPIPISLAGLARRFGVSRIHLKRMFDEAEAVGFVSWAAPGALQLEASARDRMGWQYAAQLLLLIVAAARTVKALPEVWNAALVGGK